MLTITEISMNISFIALAEPHLMETAERHTFKATCHCFENAPYTELTIVYTINVSIDCKKNEVSSLLVERNILYCK